VLLAVTWAVPAAGWFEVPQARSAFGETLEAAVVAVEEVSRETRQSGVVVEERVTVEAGDETIEVPRTYVEGAPGGFPVEPGDAVILAAAEGPQGTQYFIDDRIRRTPLWTLA